MNQQDQQAIDELFEFLNQRTVQGGPPDPQAEARIRQHFQQGPPALLYHMAQTLVAQRYTLQQTQAALAECRQQNGAPAGFAPPGPRAAGQPGYGGYGGPSYRQPGPYQQVAGRGGSGFLAGAGQLALGIGGGILGAEMLGDLFRGEGLFGDDRGDYDDRDGGSDDRDTDDRDTDDRGSDDRGAGDGTYDAGYDAGYDNGGNFDDGGFGGGDGGW